MTSSYTPNKGLEKPGNGDYVNTWSTPVNNDWDIIDKAFGGRTSLNVVSVSGTVTLTASQYQAPILILSGALTAAINYQLPSGVGGYWFIFNNTTGAYSVTLSSAGGGSSVTLAQGFTTAVICDGTNVGRADTNLPIPGGSNTQVQYNNNGTLGGSSALTWDGSTLTATAFAGAGTGLTGTAGSLSIGGNAATATSATTAGSVTSSVTFNNGGSGAASGTAFNGSSPFTVSYNTVGAPSVSGTGASGTWGISITGNAATATTATTATSATSATSASQLVTANFSIVQANGYLVIKHGTTNIALMDSSGNFLALGNVQAAGNI